MMRLEISTIGAGLWGLDWRPVPSSAGGRKGIASVIVNHLKLLVGGVQLRDGVVTVSDILGRIFTRAGFHVLAIEGGYASTIYVAHQYDPIGVAEEAPVLWDEPKVGRLVARDYDSHAEPQATPA